MDTERWTGIVSRIGRHEPVDLDDIAGAFDPRSATPGRDLFPQIEGVLMPRTEMKRAQAVGVGVRVAGALPDAADRAMRLAAFAVERDVEVVVLARGDASGLEAFGFRSERIAGDTEAARAQCEDQVRRFWNIDLVL